MNGKLSEFIKVNFADYKSDFFSAFFARCSQMALSTGILGFFSPYVWMFIQSYEKWRRLLCERKTIETLIQFEYSAFEEATVPVCTFVFGNYHINKRGSYFRLTDFRGGMEVQRQKTLEAIADHECGYYYEQSSDNFSKIPGAPVAYWASKNLLRDFTISRKLGDFAEPKQGMATMDNNKYLRLWFEVNIFKVKFHCKSINDTDKLTEKWFPYNKGGDYRKWYGNYSYLVNWENNGAELKADASRLYGSYSKRIYNTQFFFLKSITWSKISSGSFSVRCISDGCLFDVAGCSIFVPDEIYFYFAGLLNSKIIGATLSMLSPTLNYEVGHIKSLPVIIDEEQISTVSSIVENSIYISQLDWDSFEISWDFEQHPIVRKAFSRFHWNDDGPTTIEYVYKYVAQDFEDRFQRLKANEEELNRIFIDIYGLQSELTPEVEEKDVTVRRADLGRDIRSLISYAVGCMFGRYSLGRDGLAYAGGEWDENKYPLFPADKDNVIPVCDDEYFEDDILGRFVEFVRVVFGDETLDENLKFIADALGGKGQPKDVIRSYFMNDFYADHLKIYQKRPIYWLFDSGKKGGFKCLIYMHRYQPDTIARIRTDYVHEQQSRYRTAIADLEKRMESAATGERVKVSKQLKKLQEQAEEIRVYEEKIHHLADQMIKIDLDDGVRVNYAKFQDVLAKIK